MTKHLPEKMWETSECSAWRSPASTLRHHMHKEITLVWRNLNKSQAYVSLNAIIQYGNCALTVLYVLCAFKTQNLMHDLCSFSIQTASTAWKTHRYIHIRGCGWSNCQERNIRLCRWQKNSGQNVKTKQFDCKNCTLLKKKNPACDSWHVLRTENTTRLKTL